ncbi:hypothetical protein [Marinobacter alexandrii]|uniref:hypothetical protein n=1 Tax=Marinobacter alexandrii TaxID=2570351 RepID=UPI003299D781
MGLHSQEPLKILDGETCPEGVGVVDITATCNWKSRNNQLYSLLYFSTVESANITTKPSQGKSGGEMGDGAAAWAALKERFAGNTKESRRAVRKQLYAVMLRQGQNVIDFLALVDDLKLRLDDMGESPSKETFEDLVWNALVHPSGYSFLGDMQYRHPFPDVEAIKRTAVNYLIDSQSRKSSGPAASGCGAAMAATGNDR